MTITQAEIVQRVAEDLGLVPIGQLIEDQDRRRIKRAYQEVYSRLKELGFASWAMMGGVPDDIAPYYINLMLRTLLVSYSVPRERYARIIMEAQEALSEIAKLVTPKYIGIEDIEDF